jgi:hypothetical protein
MMISPRAFLLLLALLVWQAAYAQPIYKSVDSAGQITYSSTPPPAGTKAKRIEVAPPPSEEEIRQARERTRRVEEQALELENKRLEQEAAREAEEARLREMQPPQPPEVIKKPDYMRQPIYYPPVIERPPGLPPVKPRPIPQPR